MDFCTVYLDKLQSKGWPKIDAERVAKVSTEEFRNGLSGDMRAIDGLKGLGTTMLHEVRFRRQLCRKEVDFSSQLTHTDRGGILTDVKDDDIGCYEWYRVVRLKRVDNAGKRQTSSR
jgi:hypothetical protein